jgi:hypothetical protein
MDIIGEYVMEFFRELSPLTDWALNNWAVAMVFLIGMIYWLSHERRLPKRRF